MTVQDHASSTDIPVFSPRLDEIMAAMIKGDIPNVGRFCGYCYTPVGKRQEACPHCATAVSDVPTLAKIPSDFFPLYQRMRKRESLIVNSFAFGGLGIAMLIFIVLSAVAVYGYDANLWMLAGATIFFIVGGRVFAGLLGGWIGDNIGYEFAHKRLVLEWQDYERERAAGRAGEAPHFVATAANSR